jgi:ring-1,2-phenylacetyl-CoA epoxidase subunit PaaC
VSEMTGGLPGRPQRLDRRSACEDPLALGDDALIAAQRLAMWCARAPELEEDVALANIALDQLGAARLFLSLVGDEDELAYLRTDREFRNVLLVELADRDFAVLIAKLLFLSAFQVLNYAVLNDGGGPLAEIAAKTVKESSYHLDHATRWTLRLGDGTSLSHQRMQAAVDEVWPYTSELFEDAPGLRDTWLSTVDSVLAGATLTRPEDGWKPTGGRQGRHTEALSYLLAEMQVLHRAHPGARW